MYKEMNSWPEPRSRNNNDRSGHFILSSSIAICTLLLRCKGRWIDICLFPCGHVAFARACCVSRTGPRDWAGPDRLDSVGSPRWSESTPSWVSVGLEWSGGCVKESAAACRVQTAREEEDGAHVPVLQAPTRLHLELK